MYSIPHSTWPPTCSTCFLDDEGRPRKNHSKRPHRDHFLIRSAPRRSGSFQRAIARVSSFGVHAHAYHIQIQARFLVQVGVQSQRMHFGSHQVQQCSLDGLIMASTQRFAFDFLARRLVEDVNCIVTQQEDCCLTCEDTSTKIRSYAMI